MRKAIRVWKSIGSLDDLYLTLDESVIEYHIKDSFVDDEIEDLG